MSELNLTIENTPAVIDLNYEAFKAELEQHLEKYATVVTADTVKDAKALATELNALKKDLDERRKATIKYVSAPIKDADDKMKSLVSMVEDGRQHTLSQVRVFEQKRLDDLLDDLTGRRDRLRESAEVQPEFYGAASELNDLVKLGNITATGRTTSKACQAVQDRVNEELSLQQTVDRRLLELENASYRAGLAAPLTRPHVEHFLKADDDVYAEKLQALLDAEIERDRQGREAMERKAQQEAAMKQAAEAEEKARQDRLDEQNRQADQQQEAEAQSMAEAEHAKNTQNIRASHPEMVEPAVPASAHGSDTYTMTVTMTATLPAGMSESDVEEQFRQFIEGPGNVRVDFLTATKEQEAA